MRERKERVKELIAQRVMEETIRQQTYTPGDTRKNARLMLDALGLPLRRRMLARLAREGAMSVSKLAEPFRITLPAALSHVRILERAGMVATQKRGRVRMCVYDPRALKELVVVLGSTRVLHSLN